MSMLRRAKPTIRAPLIPEPSFQRPPRHCGAVHPASTATEKRAPPRSCVNGFTLEATPRVDAACGRESDESMSLRNRDEQRAWCGNLAAAGGVESSESLRSRTPAKCASSRMESCTDACARSARAAHPSRTTCNGAVQPKTMDDQGRERGPRMRAASERGFARMKKSTEYDRASRTSRSAIAKPRYPCPAATHPSFRPVRLDAGPPRRGRCSGRCSRARRPLARVEKSTSSVEHRTDAEVERACDAFESPDVAVVTLAAAPVP